MKVSQIKDDAKQVLNFCEDATLYNRLTQAIEVLAHEGNWDSMQAYMDIRVDASGIVTLPRDVESPIKININNHPAFSHDKLFEFTLNGPGNDMAETSGWAWMDKGRVCVWVQPRNEQIVAFCEKAGDEGKKIRIFGYNQAGRECSDEIVIKPWATINPPRSANNYVQITRIDKDATEGQVAIFGDPTTIPPDPEPPPPPPPEPPPPPPTQVEDPVLDPPPGNYQRMGGYITIRMSTTTSGAAIAYTLDGSVPSRTNGHRVYRTIALIRVRLPNHLLEGDVTVRVMAFKDGLLDSHVVGGAYHITPIEGDQPDPDATLPQSTTKKTTEEVERDVQTPEPPNPDIVPYELLGVYYPDELAPSYRQIKLTKNATAVRMLYRRKTYAITSDEDWIPLDSTMAILTMLKALEALRNGSPEELQKVDALYKNAVHFLQQEQASRMQFAIDSTKEIPPSLAVTYGLSHAQGGLTAGDLKADALQIIGFCEDTTYYNRLTHAIEVLSNEGQWDSLQAYMDIAVDPSGVITLPRDVQTPIKLNINGNAAFSRAKLYEFTLNGPGNDMRDTVGWSWMDKGDVPVMRQPNGEPLVGLCSDIRDAGKKIYVWGFNPDNTVELYDEITLALINTIPAPASTRAIYGKITRVLKDETFGLVGLFGVPTIIDPTPPPPGPPPPPPPIPPGALAPTFDPDPGTYERERSLAVTIRGATNGSSISFTTDGSTPTRGHGTIVPRNIAIARIIRPPGPDPYSITLKAMAFKDGLLDSSVTTGVYTLVNPSIPTPTEADTSPDIIRDLTDAGETPISGPEPDVRGPLPPEPIYDPLAFYYPNDTQPRFRQIKVKGYPEVPTAVRMLYRRKTYRITSDVDWIPLNSRMAVLTMMRSLEALRIGSAEEMQKMEAYQKFAIHLLQQDQAMLTNFDLAAQSEKPPTLDLGIYNLDSLIAADVYDDACEIYGPIGRQGIYDKITDAVELLNNMGLWDGLSGYVDLLTDKHYWITLPRYVENVVSLNINRQPKAFRNKWFEFHLNGPGTKMPSCSYWEDAGETVTLRPLQGIIQPVCYSNLASDIGKVVIIEGLDERGVPIRSQYQGEWIDGVRIRCGAVGRPPGREVQKISRIDRILKEPSDGFIQLWGYERSFSPPNDAPSAQRATPLGFYYPDETEPNYRRIKLPHRCAWVRMRYRKRALKVTGLGDPLHLKNRLAVVTAMRSIKAIEDGDTNKAEALEKKASDYLLAEQSSRNPSETFSVQFEGLDSADVII